MIKYIFTLLAALVFLASFAQNTKIYVKDSSWISMSKKSIMKLPVRADSSTRPSFPFTGFVIKDVTPDSSSIGVKIKTVAFSANLTYEKIVLQKGTASALTGYLNNNTQFLFTTTGWGLTCFIKQLRITETDSINKATGSKQRWCRLNFEAEAYLEKENVHYPALRFDTVAMSLSADKNNSTLLADILDVFAAKAALLDTERIFKRNGYKTSELDIRYLQRFNKPVLQSQQLNAGIYKTFNEFVNNNPSLKQYEFKKEKTLTILYSRQESGDWLPETKAFGFCDGKIIWLNVNNVYYPLVRQGNTFEFLARYNLGEGEHRKTPTIYNGSSPLETFGVSLVASALSNSLTENPTGKIVYQLNMENGTFY